MFRLLRSAPHTSMTSRMSPLPRLPSRLLSMTPLPEVLPPSRPPPPSTRSLFPHLSLLLPSLPLPPSPTPVCTTLATPTTLESSASPTLDFLLLPPLPPLLRNRLPRLIFPFKFIQSFCASKFL